MHVPCIIIEVSRKLRIFFFRVHVFPRPKDAKVPDLRPPHPLLQSEGFLKVEATYNLQSRRPTILIFMNTNDFLFQGGSVGWFGYFWCFWCEMRMKDFDFLFKIGCYYFWPELIN